MLALPLVGYALLPSGSFAANSQSGTVKLYECGDNCYLTITLDSGEDLTALCFALTCEPWNEMAEMPSDQIGRRVVVTVGTEQQLDADGNVMGDFPAFTKIVFEN